MPWFINDVYELCDFAILNIKSADYHCIITTISKSKTINLMQNIALTENSGTLQNVKFVFTYKNGLRNFNVWWDGNWKKNGALPR